jgi:hypothetical protein
MQALAVVLISLSFPAIALALIAVIERARREPREGMQHSDEAGWPELEVSAQMKAAGSVAKEEPGSSSETEDYRKRRRAG